MFLTSSNLDLLVHVLVGTTTNGLKLAGTHNHIYLLKLIRELRMNRHGELRFVPQEAGHRLTFPCTLYEAPGLTS